MVKSYEEEKKSAPSGIRVPKKGEPSNYRGYGWSDDTREQAAKTAKSYFDANNEGMRSSYEKRKEKGDPSSEEISRRLGEADEEAAGIMQRAHRKESKEQDDLYRLKREAGLKKGGKVKSASSRADGCAIRGKTRA